MRIDDIEAMLAVLVASARTPKELSEVALALMEAERRCAEKIAETDASRTV